PVSQGWVPATEPQLAEMVRLARIGVERALDDPEVLAWAAFLIGQPGRDLDGAISLTERALALNSNSVIALTISGFLLVERGNTKAGIDHLEQAARLNP